MPAQPAKPPSLSLGRNQRLAHAREYQHIYDQELRKTRGPLTLFAAPSDSKRPRLGLSIGRKVGGAVVRNRVKRLIREAFRHVQHDLPRAETRNFDWIVSARAHNIGDLHEYQIWLLDAANAIAREWSKRLRREAERSEPSESSARPAPPLAEEEP